MVQIYGEMGVAMFVGLSFIIVAIVVSAWIGRWQQRLQVEILACKSLRIKTLNELINGIKVTYIYT